jgi:hypothetical protein
VCGRLDAEVKAAAIRVAEENDLQPERLNDNAATFLPNGFNPASCDELFSHPRLLVLGMPIRDLFLMKMYRDSALDEQDMVAMWPLAGFKNAQEVVDAFYSAYPHAPADPYLSELPIAVSARARTPLPSSEK